MTRQAFMIRIKGFPPVRPAKVGHISTAGVVQLQTLKGLENAQYYEADDDTQLYTDGLYDALKVAKAWPTSLSQQKRVALGAVKGLWEEWLKRQTVADPNSGLLDAPALDATRPVGDRQNPIRTDTPTGGY